MNFPVSSTLSFNRTSWPSLPCFSGIGRCRCRCRCRCRFSAIKVSTISSHATSGGDFGGRSQYNRKNKLNGVIFKYGRKPIQVAFKTGDHKQQVIFIAGLSDGFLATPYLEPLATALDKEKWSLVQFLLSSSYSGYGMSSLKQDAMELDQLIKHLIKEEYSNGVVLLGHSTGCQDIVYYLRSNALYSKSVRAAILQAPVSDRECNAVNPETGSMLDLASEMISEGKGLELMPRNAIRRVPVTAYRYHSLYAYNGDDDLFSSDLTEEQLTQKLGHMSNTPCQVIFSMADEYVPEYVDKKSLVDRLCRGMGDAEKVEIENGNHALSNHVEEAVRAIVGFLSKLRDS